MQRAAAEAGDVVQLAPKPELPDHLAPVWEAFCMLSRSRGFTFGGALPIALDDMRFAFEVYGVPQHEWEYWVYLLQETDAVYLK